MAAEPVGTAYVAIRAITTRLAKDIKDGLDKGAKDADVDSAGRDLGDRLGESSGDSFGESFNERSSRSIEESADSTEMKKSQRSFTDKLFGRFKEGFDRNGNDIGRAVGERFQAGLENSTRDVDVDRAAGSLGSDLGDEVGDDFDVSFSRRTERTFSQRGNNDSINRGASGFGLRVGESIGEGVSKSFTQTLTGFGDSIAGALNSIKVPGGSIAILAQLAIPALGGALQTVGALIGSTTAVLGFLGTAAAGAAVGFAGLAAAAGPAFLLIKGAFNVDSDQLDHFNDVVDQFKEDWEAVGLATQELLLPGLEGALDLLTQLIPTFELYGKRIGEVVGGIALGAAATLTDAVNQRRIDSILQQGATIIETLGDAAVTFLTPILTILQAAMPIAQRMADAIARASDKFASWVDKADQSGALTEMFDKWYDRLALIMSILGNLGSVLADIFGIGADSVDSMFQSLDGITEKWAEWTNSDEGQNKLMTFFENAKKISGEVFGIIGDIAGRLFGGMFNTGGTDGLLGFFQTVRDVWIPTLSEFAGTIKDALGPQVGAFFDALTDFLGVLADNPAITAGIFNVFLTNFIIFTKGIQLLSDLLDTDIAKRFGPLILQMLLFAKIGAVLWPVLKLVILGFRGFFAILGAIFSPIGLVVAAIAAIVGSVLLLYFHFKPFRDFVDRNIIDPLQRLWENIQNVGGLFHLFEILPALLRILWDSLPSIDFKELFADPLGTLTSLLHDTADALRNTFEGIPLFENIANGLASALDFIARGLANLKKLFKNPFKGAFDIIGFFSRLGDVISEFVGKGLDALIRNLPHMGTILGKAFGIIVKGIIAGLGLLVTAFISHWALIIPTLVAIFQRLPALLFAALKGLANFAVAFLEELGVLEAVKKYFPIVVSFLVDFFQALPGLILQGISKLAPILGSALLALGTFMGEQILRGLRNLGTLLLALLGELPGLIVSGLQALLSGLETLVGLGADLAGQIWEGIKNFFTETLPQIVTNFITWVGDFGEDIPGFGRKIAGAIWDGLSTFLTTTLPRIISQFATWVGEVGQGIWNFGRSIAGRIWDGISVFLTEVLPRIISQFASWVGDVGQTIWNFGRSIGGRIWDGLTTFLTDILPTLLSKLPGWIGEVGQSIWNFGRSIGGRIWDGLSQFLLEILPTLLSKIPGWIGAAFSEILGLGKSIAGKIWDGLSSQFVDYMVGFPGKLFGWALAGFGALADFGWEIAKAIGQGIADFFLDNPVVNFITNALGGSSIDMTPFDPMFVAIKDGIITQAPQLAAGLQEMLNTSFGLVTTDEQANEIANRIIQGVADGTINGSADIQAVIEDVMNTSLTNADTSEGANGLVNGFANSVGAADWSKAGAAVEKSLAGQMQKSAPSISESLKKSVVSEIGNSPFDIPLPNLDDDIGVQGWASDSATTIRKSLGTQIKKVRRGEFKAPAESLVNNLGDGLDRGKNLLRTFAVGLVLTIVKWIQSTVGLMLTLGLQMMKSLQTGILLGAVAVISTVKKLPLQIITAMGATNTLLTPAGLALMAGMTRGIQAGAIVMLALLRGLRSSMVTAVGTLGSLLFGQGLALVNGLASGVRNATKQLFGAVRNLQDVARDALGNVSQVLYPAGQSLVQGMIDGMRSLLPALRQAAQNVRDAASSAKSAGGIAHLAMGGIVDGPMTALIGEAGREVVIPLTRPLRALSLLHASGLDDLIHQGSPTGGDVTLLNIEHADIHDKVDIDMVAARLNSAYKAMIPASQQGRRAS